MSYPHKSLEDLISAIETADMISVREIFRKDPELLKHPDSKQLGSELLHAAIAWKNEKLTRLLIKFGADVNLKNPLELALDIGNVPLVELLLENEAKVNWCRGSPAIHTFYSRNVYARKKMLILLLQYGMDVSFRNKSGENLLHIFLKPSIEKCPDSVKIVRILLDSGVPSDELDRDGLSPLLVATGNNYLELVQFFVENGADVNERSKTEGKFPLYFAASSSFEVTLVTWLISKGAAINAKTNAGRTALHEACIGIRKNIINLLIGSGAEISPEDNNGQTPFYLLQIQSKYISDSRVMIKLFSKLKFENHSISEKDMKLIQETPNAFEFFKKCLEELSEMANFNFYNCYSYYDVLKMSSNIKKLANLMNNEEFEKGFNESLDSCCFYYETDLTSIYNKALLVRDEKKAVYNGLYSIFLDYLPDIAIRKITEHLTINDIRFFGTDANLNK